MNSAARKWLQPINKKSPMWMFTKTIVLGYKNPFKTLTNRKDHYKMIPHARSMRTCLPFMNYTS